MLDSSTIMLFRLDLKSSYSLKRKIYSSPQLPWTHKSTQQNDAHPMRQSLNKKRRYFSIQLITGNQKKKKKKIGIEYFDMGNNPHWIQLRSILTDMAYWFKSSLEEKLLVIRQEKFLQAMNSSKSGSISLEGPPRDE